MLADAYGASLLTRDGHLPATVLAGNPEFLRPLVGVVPPGGAHLRFYAVDVARGADGRWWVLGDRAQAPSGAGYAIENRLALSRAVPDIYRASRAERLAPFFQAFQAELASLGRRDDAHICVLTPGPMSETYFEHAYLARYLGFLMVEGEDLSVRDDGVFVRTVSGLQRSEVLLRRIDADFADPLELNAASRLGAPGLLQAVRDGKVVMVNALGAGLVEARAMLAFLPALARGVLGTELAIPNVATWWLGQADVREPIIEKLDGLVIAPAFESHVDERTESGVLGAKLDDADPRGARGRDSQPQHRLCGAGSGDAVEHAGLARRALAAAAVHAAHFPHQGCRPLAGDARRFRPHRRHGRRARGQSGARRCDSGRLAVGARAGRRVHAAAGGGPHRSATRQRHIAEPRRRQSVLGRPLCRTRRSDPWCGR